QPTLDDKQKNIVNETGEIISKSLQEIRTMSKLLNPEVVKNIGLLDAIQLEIDRFNRLNFINATLKVFGEPIAINQKDEIILFRILQEFLSNSVKHSKTDKLEVTLDFTSDTLLINARDFGVGFNESEIEKGSGLLNMKSRAKLIYTDFQLKSDKEKGVSLTLRYPLPKR
ncbi:MAG: histidine kinase, partial [Flavobacteriaceae bacterium]|nr:histidine kinase [Flavobacteriaceae bacterium]